MRAPSRLTGWLLAGVALLAATLLVWTLIGAPPAPVPTAQPRAATPPAAAPPPVRRPAAAPADGAGFDIVRVGPTGETVIAGRARPGAAVTIVDAGRAIARTQADAGGRWVALPPPLAAGAHQLTVTAAGPASARAAAPLIVLVPAAGQAAPSGPLALLAPPAGMPIMLQAPQPRAPADLASIAASGRLGLGIVDYDARGAIRFAGTAPPGSIVRVYVDRRPAGDAVVDAQGRWLLQPAGGVAIGRHQLRLDQLAGSGAVSARVALPFDRVLLPDGAVAPGNVVVQPGQSLWRIARHVYGRGIRYTVIYLANRSQIRNPALIYPGQVFAVPEESASRPNPASSSTSR